MKFEKFLLDNSIMSYFNIDSVEYLIMYMIIMINIAVRYVLIGIIKIVYEMI